MIFAQRKGADLKAEEIFRKIKLEESLGARDKANARNPSGLIYNQNTLSSGKIISLDEVRKQKTHMNGHLLKDGDFRLSCSDYLSECYDEFLRMFQLASEMAKEGKIMRSRISGKPVSSITFNDYMWECKLNLIQQKKELKRDFRGGKITKEMQEFFEEIRRKCIEYCDRYIKSTDRQKIGMV